MRAEPGTFDTTRNNWTSNAATGSAMVGHHDRTGGGNSWWNSAHPSRGCGQANLVATGGAGLFYCFGGNQGGDLPPRGGATIPDPGMNTP